MGNSTTSIEELAVHPDSLLEQGDLPNSLVVTSPIHSTTNFILDLDNDPEVVSPQGCYKDFVDTLLKHSSLERTTPQPFENFIDEKKDVSIVFLSKPHINFSKDLIEYGIDITTREVDSLPTTKPTQETILEEAKIVVVYSSLATVITSPIQMIIGTEARRKKGKEKLHKKIDKLKGENKKVQRKVQHLKNQLRSSEQFHKDHVKRPKKKQETKEMGVQTDVIFVLNESNTQTDLVPIVVEEGTQTNPEVQAMDIPPTLIDVGIQTNPSFTFYDKGVQIEEVPPYTPLIVEASIRILHKTMEEQQQTIARYQGEVVPQREHQEILQLFKSLTTTEDETYAQLRAFEKKVQNFKDYLKKVVEQTKEIFSIYSNALACRSPT